MLMNRIYPYIPQGRCLIHRILIGITQTESVVAVVPARE